jgi:DNA repair protein RadC
MGERVRFAAEPAEKQIIENDGGAERPRERLARRGPHALSDAELLALVLGTGHRSAGSTEVMAVALLARFRDLRGVVCASQGELCGVVGMGQVRAGRLRATGELARRLASERLEPGVSITCSDVVFAHFAPLLADEKRETFHAVLLDSKNRLVDKIRISEGSLGASLVHPREAFRPAVREAAASVLFLHNHPSGDPRPSEEDRRVTQRLRRAGDLLGIPVLDHIVVGRNDYYSFADNGWPGGRGTDSHRPD